jgi:pimeloyl-ACP methyl ester carboxylesterase
MKSSESLYVPVRELRYHVRAWGPADAPCLILLHGWMDNSASWQFTVDALKQDWRVLAPDWRGNGGTQWAKTTYWYHEFLADLDALLDQLSPQTAVNLVGHSFGASLAMVYAGTRPQRIARLLNVDGYGPPDWRPEASPDRYVRLIKLLQKEPRLRDYPSLAEFEARLREQHPRVTTQRIAYLARAWTRVNNEGRVQLLSDPACASNYTMQFSSRLDDAMACWRAITAPVHMLLARQGGVIERAEDLSDGRIEQRLANLRTAHVSWVEDCGHMVHLEQPEALAARIESFFPHAHSTAPAAAAGDSAQPT